MNLTVKNDTNLTREEDTNLTGKNKIYLTRREQGEKKIPTVITRINKVK